MRKGATRKIFLLLLGVGLAGCGGERATMHPPAMPTIGAATGVSKPKVPENELLASASRSALGHDIPAGLRTLQLAGDPSTRDRLGGELVTALLAQDVAVA